MYLRVILFISIFKFLSCRFISEDAVLYSDSEFLDLSLNYCIQDEIPDTSRIRCLAECLLESGCVTFAHNKFTLRCRLYSVNFGSVNNGTLESGWKFYSVKGPACPRHYVVEMSTCVCFKYFGSGFIYEGTYSEKQAICKKDGAQLLRIETPALQKAMEDYLVEINADRSLIQGRYMATGFEFENGDNISYIDWDDGEPDPLNGNEVKILTLRPPLYKWSDSTYTSVKNFGFICQMP